MMGGMQLTDMRQPLHWLALQRVAQAAPARLTTHQMTKDAARLLHSPTGPDEGVTEEVALRQLAEA